MFYYHCLSMILKKKQNSGILIIITTRVYKHRKRNNFLEKCRFKHRFAGLNTANQLKYVKM